MDQNKRIVSNVLASILILAKHTMKHIIPGALTRVIFLIGMLWAGGSSLALAQQQPLSLQDALQQAQQQGFAVRSAHYDWKAAEADAHRARAAYLPQVSISQSATATNDPLNAFGFRLKKETIALPDFDPARLNDPGRVDLLTTRMEVRQPILNPEGLFEHRAARSQAEAASMSLERMRHLTAFQVKKDYFALVLARRSLAVVDSSLMAANANYDRARDLSDQGLITRADLLAAHVRVLDLESRRTEAAHAIENASDALRYTLGLEETVTIVPTDSLEAFPAPTAPVDVMAINASRSDMQALRFRVDAAQSALHARKVGFLPKLNAFGSYERNDKRRFLGQYGSNWTVGAVLEWNLFSGYRRAGAVERARADLSRVQTAYQDRSLKNEIELRAARRGIEQAREQLSFAKAAVEQARENLRIRTDRYAQGLEKTTDVLDAEVMLAKQRLGYLRTLYQYDLNIFQLELLTEIPQAD